MDTYRGWNSRNASSFVTRKHICECVESTYCTCVRVVDVRTKVSLFVALDHSRSNREIVSRQVFRDLPSKKTNNTTSFRRGPPFFRFAWSGETEFRLQNIRRYNKNSRNATFVRTRVRIWLWLGVGFTVTFGNGRSRSCNSHLKNSFDVQTRTIRAANLNS